MSQRMKRQALLAVMLVVVLVGAIAPGAYANPSTARVDSYDKDNPQNLKDDDIVSKAGLVVDAETMTVLYDKNADRQAYPASTTKIMTCLLALENSSLTDMVTIPDEVSSLPLDSSKVPVKPGEVMTMGDLLHGLMMVSGNDAAIAIAHHVAGSTDAFVELMNARAAELGCTKTHFTNPHGYHDEDHYSTAYDLALIAREALKSRDFREIVSCARYVMGATALREKKALATQNPMFVASSKYYYPDLIGVKTGTHSKAGHCFVGAAVKDGVTLISVTLRAPKAEKQESWIDTARLIDYGNTRYETLTFAEMVSHSPIYISVKDAALDDEDAGMLALQVVSGSALDNYSVRCLPEFEQAAFDRFAKGLQINLNDDTAVAPIAKGEILGTVSMEMDGRQVSAQVVATRDVKKAVEPFSLKRVFPNYSGSFVTRVLIVLGVIVLLLIIILLVRRSRIRKRDRRRQEMLRRRREAYDRYRRR